MILRLIDRACFWWVRRRAVLSPQEDLQSYAKTIWNRGYDAGLTSPGKALRLLQEIRDTPLQADDFWRLLDHIESGVKDPCKDKEPRNDAG